LGTKQILQRMERRNHDACRWNLAYKDSCWIKDFVARDKTLSQDLVLNLSQRQRKIFIEELCKGDGSKCSSENFRSYYTKNERLRDQIQMLMVMSGYTCNSKQRDDGTYYINFTEKNKKWISEITREKYSGRTFCLTVPNGTLIARRKGWVFITQNTHKIYKGIINSTLLVEQGCLADLMAYSHNPRNVFTTPSVNGYALVYQDSAGNTDFNLSGPVFLGECMPPKKSTLEI
jgi:hypothetical protein